MRLSEFLSCCGVLGALALLLNACGDDGSGACVTPTIGSITVCHNDWDKAECEDWDPDAVFNGGKICQDIGYTKSCPMDGSNAYRLPSYSC